MKPLTKKMEQVLLKIAEVNHGGLNSGTLRALKKRGLIENVGRGLELTDEGWEWWRNKDYPKPSQAEEATDG